MHNARPSTLRMFACRVSRSRKESSAAGGGSVTMPMEMIWRRVFSMGLSQVVAAVGEIEGLVDERKVRNDVADDRVFHCRPGLPRRVVGMTATDGASSSRLESHHHGAAPPFDQADSQGSLGGRSDIREVGSRRHHSDDAQDEHAGFLQLIEADGDACPDIAFGATAFARRELPVRLAGEIHAQIECLAAGATSKPDETQSRRELRGNRAGAVEAVPEAFVLI